MQKSVKVISIGAIIILGIVFLFNGGFIPVFDPGITENQFTTMHIDKLSSLPDPSSLYLNISESQINQCMALKTTCQELIDKNQDSMQVQLNSSNFNCIYSFLESLAPEGTHIRLIYYHGFFFAISFSTPWYIATESLTWGLMISLCQTALYGARKYNTDQQIF